MLSLVVMSAALAVCQSSAILGPSLAAGLLDDSQRDGGYRDRRPDNLDPWQVDKLQDYKDLFSPQDSSEGYSIRFNKPWTLNVGVKPSSRFQIPPYRGDRRGGDDFSRPPFSYLDDSLLSSIGPFGGQNTRGRPDDDGSAFASSSFSGWGRRVPQEQYGPVKVLGPFRRGRGDRDAGLFADALEPVVPFSRDFADRYYRSKVWRLPSKLSLPLSDFGAPVQRFEDSVRDYYSSRRQYAFDLISEVLRFCDCRDARARMKLWWGGLFNYDVSVYRSAVAAEVVDDLGFRGQRFRDDFRQVVRGVIAAPKTVREFRMKFLKGLMDSICDSAKSYVGEVQSFLEYSHPHPLLQSRWW